MLEFATEVFVLGDYPILFKSTPKTFADLGCMDYMLALSSTRIYVNTALELGDFDKKKAYNYNAHIIEQSLKYVTSGNKKILEDSVSYYKELKRNNILYPTKQMMFPSQINSG
jgi:hypothetical protein